MGLAILGVLVLLYILLAYFAAKTWPAWHVVILVFLFLGVGGFLILASATLKVQSRWRGSYETLVADLEREQATHEQLKNGSILDGEPGETVLRGDVRRTLVDRGRVWRNLRLADLGEGKVLLDASQWGDAGCLVAGLAADEDVDEPPAEDAAAEGAAPAANASTLGLEADSVVYAFKETPIRALPEPARKTLLGESDLAERDTQGRCKVPTFYLGEFKVIAEPNANPQSLTLTPTMPLSEVQVEQLQNPDSTWVLYEIIPVDSHEAFADFTAEQIASLIASEGMDAQRYRDLVDEYVRDLQPATEMDPPERKWLRVRFLRPHTEDVDVELQGDAGQQPLPDSLFDPSGRSIVATLNQGEKTSFAKDDEATFYFPTAQELMNDGVVEPLEPIYYRRLRDYAHLFRTFAGDMEGLSRQLELAQSDLDKLTESLSQLQTQLAFQAQQQQELEHDLGGLNTERQVLGQYRTSVEAKWKQLRQELSRLYRANLQLADRMTSLR